jgi:putative endonuclease
MGLIRYLVRRYSKLLNRPFSHERDGIRLDKDAIGKLGEDIAAKYMFSKGGKVLYRNFRAPTGGEIDIVVRDGDILCFVEVKARTSDLYGRPADAVNLDKQLLISRGIQYYLQILRYPDIPWRCDIVEVELRPGEPPAVNWIKSAFQVSGIRQRMSRRWTKTA